MYIIDKYYILLLFNTLLLFLINILPLIYDLHHLTEKGL